MTIHTTMPTGMVRQALGVANKSLRNIKLSAELFIEYSSGAAVTDDRRGSSKRKDLLLLGGFEGTDHVTCCRQ